jgi:two-component system chemotaxis response regulator CheY
MPCSPPNVSQTAPDPAPPDPAALTFLIIDDHRFTRTLIKTALKTHGITDILEAPDATEAFKLMNAPDQDIGFILVDQEMPILSGVEFTRLVRRGVDVPDLEVPIIMVSGVTAREKILEAQQCGIHEFVVKPFSVDVLYARIIGTLRHPRPFIRTKTYIGPEPRKPCEPAQAAPLSADAEDSPPPAALRFEEKKKAEA